MVLIFRERSVFFIFQSPKRTNYISLISCVSQKLAGQIRSQALFKDGRQTPDWLESHGSRFNFYWWTVNKIILRCGHSIYRLNLHGESKSKSKNRRTVFSSSWDSSRFCCFKESIWALRASLFWVLLSLEGDSRSCEL